MNQVQGPDPEQSEMPGKNPTFYTCLGPFSSTYVHFTLHSTPKRDFSQLSKNDPPSYFLSFLLPTLPSHSVSSLSLKFKGSSKVQVKSPPPWRLLSFSHNVWSFHSLICFSRAFASPLGHFNSILHYSHLHALYYGLCIFRTAICLSYLCSVQHLEDCLKHIHSDMLNK